MPPPTAARANQPAAAGSGLPEPARLGAAAPASTRAASASALDVPPSPSSTSTRAATPAASGTHTPRAAATTSKPNLSPTTGTAAAASPASRSPHTSATHLPATPSRRKSSSTSIAKSAHSLSTGPGAAPANPTAPAPAPSVAAPAAPTAAPTTIPGDPPAIDPLAAVNGNLRIAWAADTGGAHVHCAAFSPSGDLVALGLATGAVTTFHVASGKQVRKLLRTDAELAVPCTAVAWRPDQSGTLAAAFPDGHVTFWHATSGASAGGAGIDEGDNQIFAAEYSPPSSTSGIRLATAGSDGTVRVYSDPSDSPRTLTHELAHGARDAHAAGHSNRVFCLRWHPRDPNTLASGGWDSTIQIWDLASGTAVRAIYGPHICGIALDWDESGSKLVAGSARPPRRGLVGADGRAVKTDASDPPPLALYSATTSGGGTVEPVPWSLAEDRRVNSACPLYVARFSPGNKFLVAGGGGGGGGVNELKVFSYATRRCVGLVGGLPGAVFCADVTRDERRMVVAGAFRTVYVCAIDAAAAPQEIVY
ncbi:hypothetical protein GGF31_002261 [Allomyces arbusculus]|nr:hypothetical protein GGF31_002261 [Allomyces arbusculus]